MPATLSTASATETLLAQASEFANEFLRSLPDRYVNATASGEELRAAFGVPLGHERRNASEVLAQLVAAADPGLIASAGPRYFGLVIGGAHPVSVAADWLTSAWDQHGSFFASSPASSVCEDIVAAYLLELFDLPRSASVGFPTGAQTANFTALAAARHALLLCQGWDVERKGLDGAPRVEIITSKESHVTIFSALRMLGFGTDRVRRVATDDQGRMRVDELNKLLSSLSAPAIVCAQAGNVNTGAFDPLEEISALVQRHRGWLHVDGAFGLWAAASPVRRHLARGLSSADSWATDGHKWLNVPYDSGIVIVRDAGAHRASMTLAADYLQQTAGRERDGLDWVPDASRRARSFAMWATLQTLGRRGVAELIDGCCDLASHAARLLRREPGITVLNDVVINQVLFTVDPPKGADRERFTANVVSRIQKSGVLWLGGTKWHDTPAIRISVSNWMTTADDIEKSVDAILLAYREEGAS